MVALILLAVAAAGLIFTRRLETSAAKDGSVPAAKDGSVPAVDPTPEPAPDRSRRKPVLVVIANQGFTYNEYRGVRQALERANVRVLVASNELAVTTPAGPGEEPVKPDLLLGNAAPEDYGGIVFCGGNTEVFRQQTGEGLAARKLMDELYRQGKPVAALGSATLILAEAGLKRGTPSELLRGKEVVGAPAHEKLLTAAGATVSKKPVVVSDRIVTAAHADQADKLVQRLLPLLPGQSPRVLLVVAPDFWDKDYTPVRQGLENSGIKVEVASSRLDPLQPAPGSTHKDGGQPVTPDRLLADVVLADYDGIVFVGGNEKHFLGSGPVAQRARQLLTEATSSGRFVAAIGSAVLVLAEGNVVAGKEVAAQRQHHDRLKQAGALVDSSPEGDAPDWEVRMSGRLVTARSGRDARDFIAAMRRLVDARP